MRFFSVFRIFLLLLTLTFAFDANAQCNHSIKTISPAADTDLSGRMQFTLTHNISTYPDCFFRPPTCTFQMKGGSANETWSNQTGEFYTGRMATGVYVLTVSCNYITNTSAKTQTHRIIRIPPVVTINNLYEGQVVTGLVDVTATTSADASINRVIFETAGQTIIRTTAPYQLNTRLYPNGPLLITAIARDESGTEGLKQLNLTIAGGATNTPTATATRTPTNTWTPSPTRTPTRTPSITPTPTATTPGDQPPTINFTQLYNGATLNGMTPVEISGSDDIGIRNIKVYLNASLLQQITPAGGTINFTPTYNFDTTLYSDGFYTLRATIEDSGGRTTTTQISINIDNPEIGQPTFTPSATPTITPTFTATNTPFYTPTQPPFFITPVPTNIVLPPNNPTSNPGSNPGNNPPVTPNSNERVLVVKVLARKSTQGRKVQTSKAVVTYFSTKGKAKVKVDGTSTAQKAFPKDSMVAVSVKAPGGEIRTTKAYKLTQNREIKVKLVPKS